MLDTICIIIILIISLIALISALVIAYRHKDIKYPDIDDICCPVCGYYCSGKGGFGCIDKPSLGKKQSKELKQLKKRSRLLDT